MDQPAVPLLIFPPPLQTNIYGSTPFTSFKQVVSDLKSPVELFSFHSTSKGFLGECGQRGGYVECVNIDQGVRTQLLKLASISLCSNLTGQIMTGLMVNPPKPGQPSYAKYSLERDSISQSLKRRADKLSAALNKLSGTTCNQVEGALYAFPQIRLPQKAVDAARAAGKAPDAFYCLELLANTGVVVVPGSGFGQRESVIFLTCSSHLFSFCSGTYHFRTTILPSEADLDSVLSRMAVFHEGFMHKYA